MGIFSRIADIFKANVNDTLDKAEEPEKMLKQMVIEMEQSVNKATLAVANAIANEKNLERKLEKARNEKADWEQKAVQALNAGRDDLAKAALEKKVISERNFLDLQPIYQQAKSTSDKMRTQLNSLKAN
jgi:phage shock protein A